jgi:hypothetical protein
MIPLMKPFLPLPQLAWGPFATWHAVALAAAVPSVSSNVEKRRDSNDPSVVSSRTGAKAMTTHLHQTWRNPTQQQSVSRIKE